MKNVLIRKVGNYYLMQQSKKHPIVVLRVTELTAYEVIKIALDDLYEEMVTCDTKDEKDLKRIKKLAYEAKKLQHALTKL